MYQALTGILTEQKFISDCMQIQGNRKLIPCSHSHPYISFFHLLVNGFSVTLYIRTDPITLPCSLARGGNNKDGVKNCHHK